MSRRVVGELLTPGGDPETGDLMFTGLSAGRVGVVSVTLDLAGAYDLTLLDGSYEVARLADDQRMVLGNIVIEPGVDTTLNELLL